MVGVAAKCWWKKVWWSEVEVSGGMGRVGYGDEAWAAQVDESCAGTGVLARHWSPGHLVGHE
jgi:hypothetical protein